MFAKKKNNKITKKNDKNFNNNSNIKCNKKNNVLKKS